MKRRSNKKKGLIAGLFALAIGGVFAFCKLHR